MKKLILTTALVLLAAITFGQTLQKGGILGIHQMTITLKPEVTIDQFLDFYQNKVIPESEKLMDGWKGFVVKGNIGEHVNEYRVVWYIESMKDYNKFFTNDGPTDEVNVLMEKIQPVIDEIHKLGTWTSEYTDWVIQ
jgi:hypothetical protein